ncbi:MAG: hypothetical protein WC119_00735 [Synergistaceae bacterium]
MNEIIHEYIRERVTGKGKQKVGIIAGTVVNGKIIVGWSKTNLKAGDVFDKNEGIQLALDRAIGTIPSPELPLQMVDQMRDFQIRCLRYFQQGSFLPATAPSRTSNEDQIESICKLINKVGEELFGGSLIAGIGFVP